MDKQGDLIEISSIYDLLLAIHDEGVMRLYNEYDVHKLNDINDDRLIVKKFKLLTLSF